MTPRRLYGPVVLATLAAGGIAFLAAGRTWAEAKVSSDGLAPAEVSVSGADAQPLVTALALVVVTAALAILAAGPRLRRVVGLLTIVTGIAAIIAVPRSAGLDDALTSAAQESPAYGGPDSLGSISTVPWNLLTIAAFVLAIVLGALTFRFGPQWPTMSSRYDAPSKRPTNPELSQTDLWKAMDEGHDPTS